MATTYLPEPATRDALGTDCVLAAIAAVIDRMPDKRARVLRHAIVGALEIRYQDNAPAAGRAHGTDDERPTSRRGAMARAIRAFASGRDRTAAQALLSRLPEEEARTLRAALDAGSVQDR